MKKLARSVTLTTLIGVLSVATAGCLDDIFKWTNDLTAYGNAGITYVAPAIGSYSGPPVGMMWAAKYGGSFTQTDVYNYMGSNGGYNDPTAWKNSMSSLGSSAAVDQVLYNFGSTYFGGRGGLYQGLADLIKSVESGHPAAIFMFNSFGMTNGWGSSRQCFAGYCQPSMDYIAVHMPGAGGANQAFTAVDMAYWTGIVFYPSGNSSYLAMSDSDWADADAIRTTYYGDPSPPDPDCEWCGGGVGGGGDEDPPQDRLRGASDGVAKSSLKASSNRVAVVSPSSREDVVADFVAGVKRIGLTQRKGFESLSMKDAKLSVASVVKVRSLGPLPDYFIVTLADASGKVVAKGTVNTDGLLGSVQLVDTDTALVRDGASAAKAAMDMGVALTNTPERVFALGSVVRGRFDTMFLATSTGGHQIIISSTGTVYVVTAVAKGAIDQNRGGNYLSVSGNSIWTLQELGNASREMK